MMVLWFNNNIIHSTTGVLIVASILAEYTSPLYFTKVRRHMFTPLSLARREQLFSLETNTINLSLVEQVQSPRLRVWLGVLTRAS